MAPAAAAWALLSASALGELADSPTEPLRYTGDGRLMRPEHYREWIYLTSGFDMSYAAGVQKDHHVFDNVFVNPQAYRVFAATGAWPDKTVLIIEDRGAEQHGSINKSGNFQGANVMGLEVHVKDGARFSGKWAFFDFDGDGPMKMLPQSEACYSCHAEHGAVDSTFVQFYPTLLPIARSKGTLSPAYRP
jgi:Cytochrome P460